MAKNVVINDVTYNDVPYMQAPKSDGSGMAMFYDTDSGDAAASDIRNGKKAWVDGAEIEGNLPERTDSDITVSGANVTVPKGIYDSAASATVPTETKTATPTTGSQEITPSSGKLLSKVTVNGVDVTGTATEADVAAGKTFFSGGSLTRKTGTATVPTVSQDPTTKVLTIS